MSSSLSKAIDMVEVGLSNLHSIGYPFTSTLAPAFARRTTSPDISPPMRAVRRRDWHSTSTWIWLLVVLALLQMLFTDIKAATIPLLNIDCMPRRLLARTAAPAAMVTGAINFFAMRYGMKLSDWSEWMPYILGGVILATTTLVGGFLIKEPPVKNPTTEKFRPWSAMKVAWKSPRTVVLMIAVSLFQTFQVVYWNWIWLYAHNTLHMTRTQTGLTVSWAILVSMALSLPIGWLIDRISPYKLMPVYCCLAGVALWFPLHITSAVNLTIAASFVAIVASFYSAADIMVYRKAHPIEIGSITSTNSCLRGFYNGCLGILSGVLIQKTGGHYDYAFIGAFVLTCLGLVPLFIYRNLAKVDQGDKGRLPDSRTGLCEGFHELTASDAAPSAPALSPRRERRICG